MLTSHHYLLGSLFAVICAIGTVPQNIHSQGIESMDVQQSQSSTFIEPTATATQQSESIDVAYRGSGRLDDEPVREQRSNGRATIAHRGSGRVSPSPM